MPPEGRPLPVLLHDELCGRAAGKCGRWKNDEGPHRAYYEQRAEALAAALEPEIGAANVAPVIWTVLQELDL